MAGAPLPRQRRRPRSVLLLGATGLVGGHCLSQLLASPAFRRVTVLARRPGESAHPDLDWQVTDFDALEEHAACFAVDAVFCCLGTTRAKAGSATAFRRVDHDYPLASARLAAGQGAGQFLLVSALGANPRSRLLYSRTKGQLEAALRDLPLAAVHIFRPSFLMGERTESRPGERVGLALMRVVTPLLLGPLRRWRAIHAATLARAMLRRAAEASPGYHVLPSDEIERLGAQP
ncbi:MAG: oxidoreductase [Candidatus Marinimicrobia bacterium]|nr:oxidoreductase [Candidatus Neomarinimicrobiota bacterium]